MLIVCPNCATSYDVEVASLRPDGRRVRCVRCRTVWHAELPHAEKLLAADALAPEHQTADAVAETIPPPPSPELPTSSDAAASAPPVAAAEAPVADVSGPATEVGESADLAATADNAPVEVDSPSIAPTDLDAEQPPVEVEASAPAEPQDIETVAARRYPRRAKSKGLRWPLSRLQSGILALIVVNAIVVGWRADFVRAMPQTASFYAWIGLPVNLRGLGFDNLTTATEQHDNVPILVVEGNIVNATKTTEDVPHLRFAVRNAAHQEIYSWTAAPPRAALLPGEAAAFHTRLASPPPDAHDVLVRFVNRYDMLTGTR
jgi:predicted Zn finger-like uncharacterized protein